nr:hypothetical protein Cry52Nrm3_p073 [Cryptomonas curvata]
MRFFGNKLYVLLENFKKFFDFYKLINMINKISLNKLKYKIQSEQTIKKILKKYIRIGISFDKHKISIKKCLYHAGLKMVMKKIYIKEKLLSFRNILKYKKFAYNTKKTTIFRLKKTT